jgi:stearoyl-CoA desaturase (Delta-9 desaturase)
MLFALFEVAKSLGLCGEEIMATSIAALPERIVSINTLAKPPTACRLLASQAAWMFAPLKNVPFIALNLSCLAVVFVSPDVISLGLLAALFFVRMLGITGGYHRYFAHRSFKTSRLFQFTLACLGCSSMQKGPLWWVSHHRLHHKHTDRVGDPHSPLVSSFWWAHIGWILDRGHDATYWPAVRDWSRFPELRWLDHLQWLPGLLLAGGCWLVDGWSGLVWGFLLSTVLLYHATFAVNSVCHVWGSRPYVTADGSRNNGWVALFALGEGWHNNHHHQQTSARQGFLWWQIDVTYYFIKLLSFAGLVWDIRVPAQEEPPSLEAKKRADLLLQKIG